MLFIIAKFKYLITIQNLKPAGTCTFSLRCHSLSGLLSQTVISRRNRIHLIFFMCSIFFHILLKLVFIIRKSITQVTMIIFLIIYRIIQLLLIMKIMYHLIEIRGYPLHHHTGTNVLRLQRFDKVARIAAALPLAIVRDMR